MGATIAGFVLTDHARFEIDRRGIDPETIRRVLAAPEQRVLVRPDREQPQSRLSC